MESFCLTDGCGFISLNLALQLPNSIRRGIGTQEDEDEDPGPRNTGSSIFNLMKTDKGNVPSQIERKNKAKNCLSDEKNKENDENSQKKNAKQCPSVFQVRIFGPLGIFKGTLIVNKNIPNDTIILRPSMLKVSPTLQVNSISVNEVKKQNKDDNGCVSKYDINCNKNNYNNINNIDNSDDNNNNNNKSYRMKENCSKSINSQFQSFGDEVQIFPSFQNSISVEIVNTSKSLKSLKCSLNKHLILLLHSKGVPLSVFDTILRYAFIIINTVSLHYN